MIGIFIGSFNPPTLAHLNICKKTKRYFDKIVFVPVNSKDKNLIDINKRIMMLRIYTNRYPYLEIDDIMKNYSYLNYRIIDLLKEKYHDITLIIGSDLLYLLDSFDNYNYLLENYHFMVISRDNDDVRKIIQERYLKYQKKFKVISYRMDVSSSIARNLLKNNLSTKNILDQEISDFIKRNDLY